jgi:hypothetical protein
MRWESAWVCFLSGFWANHGPHSLRKYLSLSFIYFWSGPRTTHAEKCLRLSFIYFWSGPRTTCAEKELAFVFNYLSIFEADHGPHALRICTSLSFICFLRKRTSISSINFRVDQGQHALRKCTSLSFICFPSGPRITCVNYSNWNDFSLSEFRGDHGPHLQSFITFLHLFSLRN